MNLSDWITLAGLVLIAGGLALAYIPLGIIAAGLSALLVGLGLRGDR